MRNLKGFRRPSHGTQPDHLHPPYVSSIKRAPTKPLVAIPQTLSEITGPIFGSEHTGVKAFDLTKQHSGEPLGERIVVSGRVIDEDGRVVPHTLVEIWQCNAAGRYLHKVDQHDAPLDPNFTGCGHALTDAEGRYRFVTIRPGAYPWKNHHNAWRPAHIHFSVFGPAFATRLVTQMYFPGDALLPFDPIFNCTADEAARQRLISHFDWEITLPQQALGFHFDMVLAGREATPWELPTSEKQMSSHATPSQTVGPFFTIGCDRLKTSELAGSGVAGERIEVVGRVIDGDGVGVPDAMLELWQANGAGKYAHPEDTQDKEVAEGFQGFGRITTGAHGEFRFATIKPGPVPGPDGRLQAPHIVVSVFMRGLLRRLVTRIYFPEAAANDEDFVLNFVEAARRGTLVARKVSAESNKLEWNVILQGDNETVFFDIGL